MPEYEEVLGCFLTLDRWFQSVSEDSRALTQLWADEIPSSEDTQNSTSAKSRKTIEIDLFREPEHPLRPPPPWSGVGARPLYELRLASIQTSPRAVLLDFKQIWLQVSTFHFDRGNNFTHTCAGGDTLPCDHTSIHTSTMVPGGFRP